MVEVYSVSGVFEDRVLELPFWTGFFSKGVPVTNPDAISGSLTDAYGFSKINGVLNEARLMFRKQYPNRTDIRYEFTKKEGDIWIGEYFGVYTGRGKSACKVELVGNTDIYDLDLDDHPHGYLEHLSNRLKKAQLTKHVTGVGFDIESIFEII